MPGTERSEAVCFTAGPQGAPFGAGVIHAYLASGRPHPLVAAGISTGALTAAAMQRSYRELAHIRHHDPAVREAARWKWFRKYLGDLSNQPLDFLWRAIPDPVDFSADRKPVTDTACGVLEAEEAEARRHYYILVKLGVWLAGLPVRVQSIAQLLVHYVRWKERYGGWLWNLLALIGAGTKIAAGLFWHTLWAPTLVRRKPLFGWWVWLSAVVTAAWLLTLGAAAGARVFGDPGAWIHVVLRASAVGAGVLVLGAVTFFCWEAAKKGLFLAFSRHVFGQLDLAKSLLTPYQLQRRLLTLFREGAQDPEKADDVKVGKDPLHLLLVSANLKDGDQYYSEEEDPLIQGLLAAMAIPGIFPSVRPKDTDIDLIDGATVRANPLPALIRWLAKHPREAEALKRDAPSIHVVYSVPIEPYAPKRGQRQEPIDIVEAVSVARELSQRRDTRQEVQQSNFMADLVRTVESIRQERGPGPVCEFTADEIAPPRDIQFGNYWDPQPQEILAAAASGCKATLERLYPTEIQSLCEGLGTTIPCAKLLAAVAAERQPFFYPDAPGVPEICRECPRVLDYKPPANPSAPPPGITRSFGTKMADGKPDLSAFRHLHDDNPRIVFVAAGGVFRGAFHIGTIAALGACEIKPQLIVGASVGALMGGALAAISVQEDPQKALKLLHQLTTVFLHVDQKVALTAQLKNAAKQLGVRSREIALSPSEVRRMVLAGSQADAGYAAAGAPPALIDAISKLFLIPHRRTTSIASEFVAGHFSKAVNRFLLEVRRETLPSLDIEHALMGISLLEDTARKLLGQEAGISLDVVQPYQIGKTKVSFFATTSYVNQRMSLLLGRDFLTEDASYDFLKAALSSSAFPAVFSPRTEAEVVPGRGKTDVFFADGGMFDNLPFLPAIEVLNAMQVSGRREPLQPDTDPTPAQIDEVLQALRRRHDRRDIFIAAALDADPGPLREKLDTMMKVKNRAGSLQKNGKIESFLKSSRKIHAQVGMILLTERIALRKWLKGLRTTEERVWNLKLLDGIVDAAILKIVPADDEHINPTFAFCCATGMKADKVRTSIADGCYQTLVQIRKHAGEPDYTALPATLEDRDSAKAGESDCAWFRRNGQPLPCPFAQNADDQVGAVRKACAGDKKHKPVSQPIGLRLLTALQALFK